MNYFAIEYPNHTTLILKGNLTGKELVGALKNSTALFVHGTYYNANQYLSIRELKSVDERQKRVAEDFYPARI